jgi:pilus assembly protein Flp/PilA
MENLMSLGKRFVMEEDGQTLIEYGLIAAIISIGVIAAMYLLRNSLRNIFGTVETTLTAQPS